MLDASGMHSVNKQSLSESGLFLQSVWLHLLHFLFPSSIARFLLLSLDFTISDLATSLVMSSVSFEDVALNS